MTIRNLSPKDMFLALAREHKPTWQFTGKTVAQFRTWKKKAFPEVLATLGDAIPSVKPNAKLLDLICGVHTDVDIGVVHVKGYV